MPCNRSYLFWPSTSGFLNKAEKKGEPIFKDSEPVAIKSGFIEEVDSEWTLWIAIVFCWASHVLLLVRCLYPPLYLTFCPSHLVLWSLRTAALVFIDFTIFNDTNVQTSISITMFCVRPIVQFLLLQVNFAIFELTKKSISKPFSGCLSTPACSSTLQNIIIRYVSITPWKKPT